MTGEGSGKISVQSGAETVVMTKEAVVKRDEKNVKDAESVKQLRGKYLGENSTLFLLFLETCGVGGGGGENPREKGGGVPHSP